MRYVGMPSPAEGSDRAGYPLFLCAGQGKGASGFRKGSRVFGRTSDRSYAMLGPLETKCSSIRESNTIG